MQVSYDAEYDWSPPPYNFERIRLFSSFSFTEGLSGTFARAAKWSVGLQFIVLFRKAQADLGVPMDPAL
jgi:hypothetical protein